MSVVVISKKGGPGSGFHGHAGIEGHQGGSAPSSTVLFHGTASKYVREILREGLEPQEWGTAGASKWVERLGIHEGFSEHSINMMKAGHRNMYVFASKDPTVARTYAEYAMTVTSSKPIILKINVPEDMLDDITADPDDPYGWRIKGKIPPEYIEVVKEISKPNIIEAYLVVIPEDYISKKPVVVKGGPGSGHKGHRGRPGIHGGSLPDNIPTPPSASEFIVSEPKTKEDFIRLGRERLKEQYPELYAIAGDFIDIEVDYDDGTVQGHLYSLDALPKATLSYLVGHDVVWCISNKGVGDTDDNDDIKYEQPRGWPPGSTWNNVAGVYRTTKNKISAGAGRYGSENLMLHETGHAIFYFNDNFRKPRIFRALTAARDKMRGLSPYYKQPNSVGVKELIAESFAYKYSPSSSRSLASYTNKEWADIFEEAFVDMSWSYDDQ
jgi:hypothetical protein